MSDQALTTVVPEPVDEELEIHLAAKSTEEMSAAQDKLKAWLTAKIRQCRHDFGELDQACKIAIERKWGSSALKNQAAKAKLRLKFYGKVLAAVNAGYTIVPNFPVDIFAIRVDKSKPQVNNYHTDGYYKSTPSVPSVPTLALPEGDGRYVNDAPLGVPSYQTIKGQDGQSDKIRSWFKVTDYGEVEFPISCARPVVMEATAQAMAVKVFDAIGICPQRNIRKDPLIIGQIRLHPQRKWETPPHVSFLIAWHLDLRTL
jgi:hypothetical protein